MTVFVHDVNYRDLVQVSQIITGNKRRIYYHDVSVILLLIELVRVLIITTGK